jgi:putative FmdB family regulatory protein
VPIMEFRCTACGHRFEELLATADSDGVSCPSCAGRKLDRLYSVFGVRVSERTSSAPRDLDCGSCCGGGRCSRD